MPIYKVETELSLGRSLAPATTRTDVTEGYLLWDSNQAKSPESSDALRQTESVRGRVGYENTVSVRG